MACCRCFEEGGLRDGTMMRKLLDDEFQEGKASTDCLQER